MALSLLKIVQRKVALAVIGVGSVAGEAILGEDRLDLVRVTDLVLGRGRGDQDERGQEQWKEAEHLKKTPRERILLRSEVFLSTKCIGQICENL